MLRGSCARPIAASLDDVASAAGAARDRHAYDTTWVSTEVNFDLPMPTPAQVHTPPIDENGDGSQRLAVISPKMDAEQTAAHASVHDLHGNLSAATRGGW